MKRRRLPLAAILLLAACGGGGADSPTPVHAGTGDVTAIDPLPLPHRQTHPGDLDAMRERRAIRALVPYSRTFYFIDHGGVQRGLMFEFLQEFEKFVNERFQTRLSPISVMFIPTHRDRLLPALLAGHGDVVAANLSITEERSRAVLFTRPLARNVREVVVSSPHVEVLTALEDLSGRRVFVRRESSFHESLQALNRQWQAARRAPVLLDYAPGHFEAEDMLEMVNAGLVDYVITDHYLARFWSQIHRDMVVHEELALREDIDIAFAVRPESVGLKALLDEFIDQHRAGTLFGNVQLQRYLRDTRWVRNATDDAGRARFQQLVTLFQRYGNEYNVDWLLSAAQGYQESRLDQNARSPAGAIGIMQLLPSTGADMAVGNIEELDANIHAGIKYVRWVMDHFYNDPALDQENRLLFALASYNAGPGRVRSLRQEAAREGLDPNQWFNHVEHIAARRIGRETVQYVSNIYKYQLAYRLALERAQREAVAR